MRASPLERLLKVSDHVRDSREWMSTGVIAEAVEIPERSVLRFLHRLRRMKRVRSKRQKMPNNNAKTYYWQAML